MKQATPTTAFLSLGSNMGDRQHILREAVRELERHDGISLTSVSSIYETDPVGLTDQPCFYNIAVELTTTLPPLTLLHFCQDIENRYQRERKVHWGPRTLDIDLLTFGDLSMTTPELTLPHPRMQEREFVQIPLRELETGEIGCSEGVRPLYSQWFTD